MSPAGKAAEDLLGTVLEGAYRIERLVGEGGMGAVYEAAHLRLGTRVAVKVMARELAANPEALARFHREALVTSGLGHPHIVKVLDFSTTPSGEPFLAMEFLEGEDLEHRLRRVRRLPIAEVVHIIKQVASALAATHAKAIVHRDLKPGNIFLLTAAGENDFVKVLDFGISKVRSASTKLTRTSSVMGTPAYMSPEQARGHIEDIDERTDQWALACIVWECLSGRGSLFRRERPIHPFSNRTRAAARAGAQGGRPSQPGRGRAPARPGQGQERPLRQRKRLRARARARGWRGCVHGCRAARDAGADRTIARPCPCQANHVHPDRG